MTTKFGKQLRIIRIESDENIYEMAKRLDISTSYLSAIETGDRAIPNDLVEKINKAYDLTPEQIDALQGAEAESATKINVDLSHVSAEQKKLIFALSRKLNDLSDQECLEIYERIKNDQ